MTYFESPDGSVKVELHSRYLAALLAWLIPGAGHLYQRRYAKGLLFSVTILMIYFVGFFLGNGKVVYASFEEEDWRWQFFVQSFVGTPTFPAILQGVRHSNEQDPLWVTAERYPMGHARQFSRIEDPADYDGQAPTLKDGFMAPPARPNFLSEPDVLAAWHAELGHYFDIGTLYTFVAGLLNLLAIYDAFAGPAIFLHDDEQEDDEDSEDRAET